MKLFNWNRLCPSLVIGLLLLGNSKVQAQPRTEKTDSDKEKLSLQGNYSIGKTFVHKSKVLSETRSIMVSLPGGYRRGNKRYPVVYLLDGRNNFMHTTSTARFLEGNRRIPKTIVVAINNTHRTRDLTPKSESKSDLERFPKSGGADNFHKYLQTELIPLVEKTYRTTKDRTLIGHSFGGLFVFHLVQNHPDTFSRYIAISPSLWWDSQGLVKSMEEKLKEDLKQTCRLFVTLGNEKGKMIESFEKMKTLFEKDAPETMAWKFQRMDDETHGSIPLRSTYRGLTFVLKGAKGQEEATQDDVKSRSKNKK